VDFRVKYIGIGRRRGAEVGEFVGVDDRVDAADLTAGDIERDHGNQVPSCVELQRTRTAVDLKAAQRRLRTGAAEERVDQRPRDPAASSQRPRERGDLAAAVARHGQRISQLGVVRGSSPLWVMMGSGSHSPT
jgi:hypothetical protein